MPNKKEIRFPPSLVSECNKIVIEKFSKYGNSWKARGYDNYLYSNYFWNQRLENEVKEFLEAEGYANKKKELLNIVNVCRMIYPALEKGERSLKREKKLKKGESIHGDMTIKEALDKIRKTTRKGKKCA